MICVWCVARPPLSHTDQECRQSHDPTILNIPEFTRIVESLDHHILIIDHDDHEVLPSSNYV